LAGVHDALVWPCGAGDLLVVEVDGEGGAVEAVTGSGLRAGVGEHRGDQGDTEAGQAGYEQVRRGIAGVEVVLGG
jgi:hypothetical protein